MGEWDMVIRNVIEKMYFIFLEHQCGSDRVYRRIAPTFVEETTRMVQ